ncbi:MAG TPA: PQQ-dependent sugar dehydrogenase [Candidatus Dormibacteraeota bacterium]|nr:PQQ-dependent sugar dehydrogenase [Candidatus Dormibacteraeota bacterium]
MNKENLCSLGMGLAFAMMLAVGAKAQASADVSIANTPSPNPATIRKNLTFGMNVINNGPDRATGVRVINRLPAGMTLVSANFNFIGKPATACVVVGTMITCNIGTLDVGAQAGAAVFIVVSPQAIGVVVDTANVVANEADPDTSNNSATAQTTTQASVSDPVVVDPNLVVGQVVTGLTEPTSMVFLADGDFLVLEKSTGKVKRVVGGTVQSTVLDLGVNSAQERGLLGIALHPDFANNGFVYLYWTCHGAPAGPECDSLFGEDTAVTANVPLLGNRVDRFHWNGSLLIYDKNLIRLHAYQADAGQPLRGNHNCGKIAFGLDGKLYVCVGDNGRRGWMQNITTGFGPDGKDDQFGGPEPDNAHLTGAILRLNDDGSTPEDNPFVDVELPPGTSAEAAANIAKVFSYGLRNSFGLAFDPWTGQLWESENGDDSGSEINRIEAGANGGWTQIMGLINHIEDYKAIETSPQYFGLQQIRWLPTLIADSADDALGRLFMLPGAFYNDPLFTWKYAVDPAGLGFIEGDGLGAQFNGDMIIGGARDFLLGGHLFRFKLTDDRMDLDLSGDSQLAGRRAENNDKWDITGSESLLFGRGFGITTDIVTAPNGHLCVVSLTNGAVYEIFRRP